MNYAKSFCLVAAFLFAYAAQAQQVKVNPDIQAKLNAFVDLSNQQKWDQAFDLMYPKLFAKVPKQDLVDLMTSMQQDGLSLTMSNIQVQSVTVPFEEGNETYVKVEYTGDLSVQVAKTGGYSAPKAIQAMTEQFQTAYGKNNVKYDEANKKYNIATQKSMMAIRSDNQWYLVEINRDQKELMEFLFPESVMDALIRLE